MKITEIEGYETLATKADLKELRTEMRDQFKALELSIREWRVDVKEQFQRIKVLIWLPVVTGLTQILVVILKH